MATHLHSSPHEPTVAALSGSSLSARMRRLLLATRPAFAPASLAPVLVGSAWGAHVAHHFDVEAAVLALLATVCVHFGANVLNDVADDLSGADRGNEGRIFPYTGGSRFIQNGILTAREMTVWGATLLGIAALLGAMLAAERGPGVIVLGLIGVTLAVAYSLPRAQLAARGLGELAIAIAFGLLPVTGAAWLQSGRIDAGSLLISVPIGLWVASILLMNEVPDREADARAGKATLVVRWGVAATRWVYLGLQVGASTALLAAATQRLLPLWTAFLPLLLLPAAWRAARAIREPADRLALTDSIQTTLVLQMAGSTLVLAAVLWSMLVR